MPSKNTPTEIINRLNKEISAGLADPKLRAQPADLGGTVLDDSPADFGKLIAEKWKSGPRSSSSGAPSRTDPRRQVWDEDGSLPPEIHIYRSGSNPVLWVFPLHVRSGAASGNLSGTARCRRCANSGLMHCSKEHPHSITSSARCWRSKGASRPSALAVFRLIVSTYLVGACTGKSAGFSPLRMRSA